MPKRDEAEAHRKAWDTRGRAKRGAGSGNALQSRGDFARDAEAEAFKRLAAMQSQFGTGADDHNPVFIMGSQHATVAINDYLARAGATDMEGAPLPPEVKRGKQGECYNNATNAMLRDNDLDFCEGIAYPPDTAGMAFLHAWAISKKTGKVVDPTWDKPEGTRYYGVRYDRTKYFRHVMKTKKYGVLGGDPDAAQRAMDRGGLK